MHPLRPRLHHRGKIRLRLLLRGCQRGGVRAVLGGLGGRLGVRHRRETLLSNLPYYHEHGFGSEAFEETSFDDWVNLAKTPALPASLALYNEAPYHLPPNRTQRVSEECDRDESLEIWVQNWEKLILSGNADQGKVATVYKSEKISEIVRAGYMINGGSGDQWSLAGFATATQSFKLPNPMYCIA